MSSTADIDEVIQISENGVTVRKSFAADEFPVPAIHFEIESEYDEPVSVHLSEQIPESFPMDGVGFHPDYHSDNWTAFQDNHVEFSGSVDPGSPLETVYGVRIDDHNQAAAFLTEPKIINVDVKSNGSAGTVSNLDTGTEAVDDTMIDDIMSEDRNQVVKDMLSGDSDTVPGLDDDDRTELELDLGVTDSGSAEGDDATADDDTPDLDLDFGDESISDSNSAQGRDDARAETESTPRDRPQIELDLESAAAAANADDESDDRSGRRAKSTDDSTTTGLTYDDGSSTGTGESVGATLAAELRNGRLDDDDLDVLKSELEMEGGLTGSEKTRLDHLQSRLEKVASYTVALEEFLDENGSGKELIDGFKDDLAAFEADMNRLSSRVDATESTVETVTDDVDDLEDRAGSIESNVRRVRADVDDLEKSVDDIEGDVRGLRRDVTDIKDWRSELGSMFSE